jgi:hypothetical protein
VPLVVGVAFVPPSGLAVMLGCLRVVKHLGGVGRFALGAGGPLVRCGGALMRPAPTLDLLVMLVLVVAGHRMSLPAGRPLAMIWPKSMKFALFAVGQLLLAAQLVEADGVVLLLALLQWVPAGQCLHSRAQLASETERVG